MDQVAVLFSSKGSGFSTKLLLSGIMQFDYQNHLLEALLDNMLPNHHVYFPSSLKKFFLKVNKWLH